MSISPEGNNIRVGRGGENDLNVLVRGDDGSSACASNRVSMEGEHGGKLQLEAVRIMCHYDSRKGGGSTSCVKRTPINQQRGLT